MVSYSALSSADIARIVGATTRKGFVYIDVSQLNGTERPTLIALTSSTRLCLAHVIMFKKQKAVKLDTCRLRFWNKVLLNLLCPGTNTFDHFDKLIKDTRIKKEMPKKLEIPDVS